MPFNSSIHSLFSVAKLCVKSRAAAKVATAKADDANAVTARVAEEGILIQGMLILGFQRLLL